MRISDWSSDVCSSDLHALGRGDPPTTTDGERIDYSKALGNKLFLPALVIPATALLGTFFLKDSGLIDPGQVTLISLGVGVLIAVAVCFIWLRPPALAPLQEGRRRSEARRVGKEGVSTWRSLGERYN